MIHASLGGWVAGGGARGTPHGHSGDTDGVVTVQCTIVCIPLFHISTLLVVLIPETSGQMFIAKDVTLWHCGPTHTHVEYLAFDVKHLLLGLLGYQIYFRIPTFHASYIYYLLTIEGSSCFII